MAAGNTHNEQADTERAVSDPAVSEKDRQAEEVSAQEAKSRARSRRFRAPEPEAEHAEPRPHRRRSGPGAAEVAGKIVGFLASVIRWIGVIFALVLVIHVVLTIGGANKANGITQFVRDAADILALGFRDLFTPADAKLRVLVNYGIAAIFWLAVSAILARIVRAIGGRSAAN